MNAIEGTVLVYSKSFGAGLHQSADNLRRSAAAAAAAAASNLALSAPARLETASQESAAQPHAAQQQTSIAACEHFVQAVRASPGYGGAAAGEWIGVEWELPLSREAVAKRKPPAREHIATQVDSFVTLYVVRARARVPLHYHEMLLSAPPGGGASDNKVKLYADLDVDRDANPEINEHELVRAFLALLTASILARCGSSATPRYALACASDPHKISYHVAVTNVHVRHVRHARVLLERDVVPRLPTARGADGKPKHPVDLNPFDERKAMRLVGSYKRDDPARRVLVPLDAATLAPLSLTAYAVRRSLITACHDADTVLLPLTADELNAAAKPPPREPRHGVRAARSDGDDLTDDADAAFDALLVAEGDARVAPDGRTTFRARDASLLVMSASRDCAIKGAPHTSATIYWHVDVRRARYRQLCHAGACKGKITPWVPLASPAVRPALPAKRPFAVSVLLGHTSPRIL